MEQPSPKSKKPRAQCPTEILEDIEIRITDIRDLCSFVRCSSTTYVIAINTLWNMDIELPGKPALYRAIENHDMVLAKKALTKYNERGARGLLDGSEAPSNTFSWDAGVLAHMGPRSPVMLAVGSGSMDMLKLVVTHEAKCNLDMRVRIKPEGGYGCWVHENCISVVCRSRTWRFSAAASDDASSDEGMDPGPEMEVPKTCVSALHFAVSQGRPDMLRFLLEKGADVGFKQRRQESRNRWDCMVPVYESILASAQKQGLTVSTLDPLHTEMMAILEEYGVNVSTSYQRFLQRKLHPWR